MVDEVQIVFIVVGKVINALQVEKVVLEVRVWIKFEMFEGCCVEISKEFGKGGAVSFDSLKFVNGAEEQLADKVVLVRVRTSWIRIINRMGPKRAVCV